MTNHSKLLNAATIALRLIKANPKLLKANLKQKVKAPQIELEDGVSNAYALAAIRIAKGVGTSNLERRYDAVVTFFKHNKTGSIKELAEFLECEYHLVTYLVVRAKKRGDLPKVSYNIEQASAKFIADMRSESLWNGVSMRLLSVPFTEFSNTLNTLDYQRRI